MPINDQPDLTDPDNPEWTEEDFRLAMKGDDLPDWVFDAFPNTKRPQTDATKVPVSIRLSPEVVDHFKADGPGWQSRIDAVLKAVAAGGRVVAK